MFRHLLGDQGPTFSALNLTIVNRKHVFYIVTVIFQVCRHSGAGNRNLCGRQPFRGGKIGLFAKNPVPRGLNVNRQEFEKFVSMLLLSCWIHLDEKQFFFNFCLTLLGPFSQICENRFWGGPVPI